MSEPDVPVRDEAGATAGARPSSSDQTGDAARLFADRYRLVTRRGSGIDVALFEAVDTHDGSTVAVRIVHPDVTARPGFDERFQSTMSNAASIHHPNLVEIRDIGRAEWEGRAVHYVATENLTGGSLRDLRDRGRLLSPSQAVVVGLDACRALDAVHRAGVVHGDIRPTSLVFGSDGRLRLGDVGLGALMAADAWADLAAMGVERARFASPEQATGGDAVVKSDVYALCLCLIEAVTGSLPFVGDSTVATLTNRVDRLMPVSADLGPLAAVLERAGRPEANDRYSAAEFGRALVQAAEKLPRPAPLALLDGSLFADSSSNEEPSTETQVIDETSVDAAVDRAVADSAAADRAVVDGAAVDSTVVGAGSDRSDSAGPTPDLPPPPSTAVAETGELLTIPSGAARVPPPPPSVEEMPAVLGEPRARRRLTMAMVLVLLAAAIGGGAAWWFGRSNTDEIPVLAGLEQGEALNMISEFGWDVGVVEEPSDEVEAGLVIRTDPSAGAALEPGSRFTIVVSSGPAPRELPEITGLTVEQATAELDARGLVFQVTEQLNDESVPAGVILRWSVSDQPALVAGDTVLPGTVVSAAVSAGPAPRVVPLLVGLSLADAAARLAELDLVLAQVPDEFSSTVPVGGVARQDPPEGTELERGATVTVALSMGPDLVVIPPLAGLTPAQATEALNAAGLAIGAVKGDPAGVNILSEVGGRSIAAGESFPRGTAIDLTFGVPAG